MTRALVHFHYTYNGMHAWPDPLRAAHPVNYGDTLVCAAILRQLKLDGSEVKLSFGSNPAQKFEKAIFRGSTYLHNQFDFAKANATIDAMDAETAIVGLGAQNPTADVTFLDSNEEARGFIARLSERSRSISVRGAFSARVAERLGAKNIRITGCPTIGFEPEFQPVRVSDNLRTKYREVGLSIHSHLSKNIFCRDPESALAAHGAVLRRLLADSARVRIFEQGVQSEAPMAARNAPYEERLGAASAFLTRIGLQGAIEPARVLTLFASIRTVEEWLAKARDLDAIAGFRFHGNMVGLAQGRPCFFIVYDSRIEEFCKLYRLPYADCSAPGLDPVNAILRHDWDITNAALRACRAELAAFWEENGVPHKLAPVQA